MKHYEIGADEGRKIGILTTLYSTVSAPTNLQGFSAGTARTCRQNRSWSCCVFGAASSSKRWKKPRRLSGKP